VTKEQLKKNLLKFSITFIIHELTNDTWYQVKLCHSIPLSVTIMYHYCCSVTK